MKTTAVNTVILNNIILDGNGDDDNLLLRNWV
jgi:hypothetical protein